LQEFAKDEADVCVVEHPNTQWRAYNALKQQEITDKINGKLITNGITSVGEDVIAWKMHILVRDGLAKKKNGREKASK
jgi:poly-D-alanine transfer protein DltD